MFVYIYCYIETSTKPLLNDIAESPTAKPERPIQYFLYCFNFFYLNIS